jgi:ADP-heptose:LPS heptosyltransferase
MVYAYKKLSYRIVIPVFDMLGRIIFYPFQVFKRSIPLNPKNILIVRLDHIGDFVCTTPLFSNLKKKYPDAKITVLINSSSKDLAYRNPNIDKVITFSPFHLSRSDKSSGAEGLRRIIKDVKNIGFDIGIDPRGDLLSILIMWLGGVKYRVGYGITGGGFLLNKMCVYDESKHVIDRNLALLEAIDIPISNRYPEVYFNEKDEGEVRRLFNEKWDSLNQREIGVLGQSHFSMTVHRRRF